MKKNLPGIWLIDWLTHTYIYILFRDFTGGTLGLAWVASASGASGGICEKYKTYAENINGIHHKAKRSLNTGMVCNAFLIFYTWGLLEF